jgi:hypothetical protein
MILKIDFRILDYANLKNYIVVFEKTIRYWFAIGQNLTAKPQKIHRDAKN